MMFRIKKSLGIMLMLSVRISSILAHVTAKQYASMPELFHTDNYDYCMKYYGEEALYCTINVQIFPENAQNISEVWKIVQEMSSNPSNYKHNLLRHKICVSEKLSNFSETDLKPKLSTYYTKKYENIGIRSEVNVLHCENNEPLHSIDIHSTLFGIFLLMYGTAIISATIYDEFIRQTKDKDSKKIKTWFMKLVQALSLRKNWNRLMTVKLPTKEMQSLSCIQGVRLYNMVWVVTIHTILSNVCSYSFNPEYVESATKQTLRVTLSNSTFAMQNFFMISSWLVAYNFFKDMNRGQEATTGYLFRSLVKRYMRLTPTLAFLIALCSTWYVHFARGPFWEDYVGGEYHRCRENWWLSILYVNNFVKEREKCFAHGWYLTLNMQYYVISLMFLWVMWIYEKWIPLILGSGLLAHIILSFRVIYENDYNYIMKLSPEYLLSENMFNYDEFYHVYTSPIVNFSSLIAGLAYGYIFYKFRNQQLFTKKIYVILWWILTHTVDLVVILLPSVITIDPKVNPVLNAIFGSVWRSLFSFSSGMIIFGMTQGQGWIIRWACESTTMYILGRLTYSAYLIHPLLQRIRSGIKRTPNYITMGGVIFEGVEDVGVAFGGALILTLIVEMPFSELYKLLTTRTAKGSKN